MTADTLSELVAQRAEQTPDKIWLRDLREDGSEDYSWGQANQQICAIGAMLAQRLDPWNAATIGVLAHALAGDLAAQQLGERGMLASDISQCLPAVLNPSQ